MNPEIEQTNELPLEKIKKPKKGSPKKRAKTYRQKKPNLTYHYNGIETVEVDPRVKKAYRILFEAVMKSQPWFKFGTRGQVSVLCTYGIPRSRNSNSKSIVPKGHLYVTNQYE